MNGPGFVGAVLVLAMLLFMGVIIVAMALNGSIATLLVAFGVFWVIQSMRLAWWLGKVASSEPK